MSSWSNDIEGHAKKWAERYCELANSTTQQLYKVGTPCIDDHHFKEEEMGSVGEMSRFAHKLFWYACIWRALVDLIFNVPWTNLLVLSQNGLELVTNAQHVWSHTLFIQVHTEQYCHVGKIAQQCRLGLFVDSVFAGDLEDSKINIRWTLVHIRKSHVRANKLDVQETDFSFTQFNRSWNYSPRCRFTHGWNPSSWSLGIGW